LWKNEEVSKEVPADEDESEKTKDPSENIDFNKKDEEDEDEEDEEEKKEKKTKTVKERVPQWVLQNQQKPIWTRSPKEITEEEYHKFYKVFSKDEKDPLAYVHFTGEGEIDFKAILYIPSTPPGGMFDPEQKEAQKGLRLYVKRVFITDDFTDMFPKYLNFIRGMVDSDNLPLNVSREILQQDRTLALIKKKLARKVIALIQNLADDPKKYAEFWEQYGTNIKYGVSSDAQNRNRLSKLLRYYSSKTKELTSLDDYVSRMKEGQNQIYYICGESKENLEKSPFIEKLIRKGYEVLFMTDPIDEWTVQNVPRFDNKWVMTDVSKEGFKIDGDTNDTKQYKEEFKPLLDFLKTKLSGKIAKAVISDNLIKAPSAISSSSYGFSANMERLMKAQTFTNHQAYQFAKSQRILEINPRHPIILELNRRVKESSDDIVAGDLAELMFDTASLQSGFNVEDPAAFAGRIHRMMKMSLSLDAEAEPDTSEYDSPTSSSEASEQGSSEEASSEEQDSTHNKDEL